MSKILGGSAFGRSDALIDTTDAILLDETHVAVLGSMSMTGVETVIALELEGRVNRTTDRHDVLYLLNADGAAGIISELLGVAGRADPAFLQVLLDRIDALPRQS
jgi:hypothetical protein